MTFSYSRVEVRLLIDLCVVRVVRIPVDDKEFVGVREACVLAFLLQEGLHCWDKVVADYGVLFLPMDVGVFSNHKP